MIPLSVDNYKQHVITDMLRRTDDFAMTEFYKTYRSEVCKRFKDRMKDGKIVTKTVDETVEKGIGTVYTTIGSTALNHDGANDAKYEEEIGILATPTPTQSAYTTVTVKNDKIVVTTKQINGFVLDNIQKVPEVGDSFDYENFTFEVIKVDGRRAEEIKLVINPKDDENEDESHKRKSRDEDDDKENKE